MMDYASLKLRPTVAEIDLSAIRANMRAIREHIGPGPKIIPAVKANAYGHGAVEVSRAVLEAGADMLGVATLEEAIELRDSNIRAPILLLSVVSPDHAPEVLRYDVVPVICDEPFAVEMSRQAAEKGVTVSVHVKVDTGMGRIGVRLEDSLGLIRKVAELPGLRVEGLLTHFACSDDDKTFTRRQIEAFTSLDEKLRSIGIGIPFRHCANSAAILGMPETTCDAVRPGIMVYGLYPSPSVPRTVEVRQAMTLKTRIVFLKWIEAGDTVSYGRIFRADRRSLIATVPIGYADGLNRMLSGKGSALVRGRRVPIAGRVCMDQTMLDVTDVPGVALEDEVVFYGRQGDEMISIEEIAQTIGTIPYEVCCAVSSRVPRVYKGPSAPDETIDWNRFLPDDLRAEVTIREVRPQDAQLLVEAFARLSERSVAFFHPHPFDRANAERIAETAGAPNLRLVGVSGGRVVGYAFFEPSDADVPVVGIGVADEFQGRKLGGALMDALAAGAKARGWPGLRLTVFKTNERALRLYISRGYRIIGERGEEWIMETRF